MVRVPGLLAVRALEEAVVSGAVVTVGALKQAAVGLGPGLGLERVRRSVVLERREAVVGGPAVVGRVREVRLAAKVEGDGTFVDGRAAPLPALQRLRDHANVAHQRNLVVAQLLDAQGLVLHPVEAG